ncbi:hypothetical protein F4824DRAFT_70336 [Ustulina deusta]|nr:hypothetical protein F4824DRAFT_70336 [Ustulina deusta]
MTRKRKRTFPDDTPSVVAAAPNARPTKLVKTDAHPNIEHPLLLLYYPRVCTLREWALARLPATSRLRRRKLASEGLQTGTGEDERALGDPKRALGHLLDTTFVAEPCADGTVGADPRTESEAAVRWYKYERFWRRGDDFALLDGRFKELPFRQGRVCYIFERLRSHQSMLLTCSILRPRL